MKKIILIAFIILTFPLLAFAKGSWATREEGSHFFIEGECAEKEIKIEFFAKTDDEKPAFAREVECAGGRFSFSGDLLKKKLATGNYVLAVDGEKSQNTVAVKEGEEGFREGSEAPAPLSNALTTGENIPNENASMESVPSETSADSDVKFLAAFAAFQQSLLDMRTWLAETSYSSLVKRGIDSTLDKIDLVAGKIADLLWAEENPEEVSRETAEEVASNEEAVPESRSGDSPSAENQALQSLEVREESLPLEELEGVAQ